MALQDPATVVDRLLARKHRVVGVATSYQPVEGASNPPSTRFPDISVGYHLYADPAGATEALQATTDVIAIGKSRDVQLAQQLDAAYLANPLPDA